MPGSAGAHPRQQARTDGLDNGDAASHPRCCRRSTKAHAHVPLPPNTDKHAREMTHTIRQTRAGENTHALMLTHAYIHIRTHRHMHMHTLTHPPPPHTHTCIGIHTPVQTERSAALQARSATTLRRLARIASSETERRAREGGAINSKQFTSCSRVGGSREGGPRRGGFPHHCPLALMRRGPPKKRGVQAFPHSCILSAADFAIKLTSTSANAASRLSGAARSAARVAGPYSSLPVHI